MKAIRIDVTNCIVEQVELEHGNLAEIYRMLSCHTIDCVVPSILLGRDCIYVDDEALLKSPEFFFAIAGYAQPLAGSALILGTDEEGASCSCETPIGIVAQNVEFLRVEGGFEV